MSNKLHEILAIEQDRKNKANQTIGEVKKSLFQKLRCFRWDDQKICFNGRICRANSRRA
jgi:hypothetical protein